MKSVKALDLVGKVFGRLIVKSRAPNNARGRSVFTCVCLCGNLTTIDGNSLSMGHTKSCGCLRVDLPTVNFTTHGMANKCAEYRIWTHIKTRCYNSRSFFYHRYGGRGIKMCDAWRESFAAFYRDMGERPADKQSIDRIDNDGDYTAENCRWATRAEQAANKSSVKIIEHDGVRDTIAGWSRTSGVPYMKLRRRLIDGWSINMALNRP